MELRRNSRRSVRILENGVINMETLESGIFKTEMPILVKEIDDEWEEVKCK